MDPVFEFAAALFFLSLIGFVICTAFVFTADGKERIEYTGWAVLCFIVCGVCVAYALGR